MNETFLARLTSVLFLILFLFNLIAGKGIENWDDFISGLAFAISIYYVRQIIKKRFRR